MLLLLHRYTELQTATQIISTKLLVHIVLRYQHVNLVLPPAGVHIYRLCVVNQLSLFVAICLGRLIT